MNASTKAGIACFASLGLVVAAFFFLQICMVVGASQGYRGVFHNMVDYAAYTLFVAGGIQALCFIVWLSTRPWRTP